MLLTLLAPNRILLTGPGPVFTIGLPAVRRISVSSREILPVPIKATVSGSDIDVTTATVSMAFLANAASKPVTADWVSATWEQRSTLAGYPAQCLIGPSGTVELAVGTWNVWVRIQLPPVDVQEPAGQIRIV